jgi:protein-L-isoaspartate(D-aspartate) O-methyltransferase
MNSPDFNTMRKHMIDSQLRTSGVCDGAILAAMGAVPRENFVPADRFAVAYLDRAIPIANNRVLNPPISAALLLDAAQISRADRVLLVGAGCGYLAAIATNLAAHIVAVEDDAALYAIAKANLAKILVANVDMVEGPLTEGWSQNAPYDLIIIDGAIQELPEALVVQLADNGRLVCGQLRGPITALAHGIKRSGAIALRPFIDSEIAPLRQFAKKPEFVF